jgi:Xaa-Pro aminopeptidase
VPTENLVDKVWGKERPERPSNTVFPLEEMYAGKSIKDKIARLREQIQKKKASATVVTQLDEVAWLLNLRGSDIPFNPGKPVSISMVIERTDHILQSSSHTRQSLLPKSPYLRTKTD